MPTEPCQIYMAHTQHACHTYRIFLHVSGSNKFADKSKCIYAISHKKGSTYSKGSGSEEGGRGVSCTGLHVAYKLKLHIVSVQTFCVLLKENVLGNVFAKNSAKLVRQRETGRERDVSKSLLYLFKLNCIENTTLLYSYLCLFMRHQSSV